MLTLGILEINSSKHQLLEQQLESQTYRVVKVENKDQLNQIDGLILSMDKKEQMNLVIDWLLLCQKSPSVFVWVFSTIPLDYEENILFTLGANGVVMTKDEMHYLTHLVNNTFNRLERSSINPEDQSMNQVINEKNQTVLVNGVEQALTKKEYLLFSLLYEHSGTTLLYEELMEKIWLNQPKENIFLLANSVFRLRNKLNGSNDFEIKTIRSKGYMLKIKGC
ncbi:winged helix-turn-helix domain-containing protein [Enterococcus plantarum]|uniref:winged helix-turn-helix domain-containing protein n=1 Tax=Enterococcus TaxID=1350 RepID=UPI001A8DC763|nr:winged helix-turn-helix domain-containing protein [Enterococcus plantarum]MBO0423069.1 winged helix-turn-helix transcriptional regulator [Enterococcus plantarum]